MNYPPAIQRRSPKHGYGNDDQLRREGICAHSMEGPLAAAFGELDRPDRQASWHFSVAKDGKVYQHLDTEHISYASGSYNANKRFWSIEQEGYAGEPFTGPQLASTIPLVRWLLNLANLPPIRMTSLFEHNEMTAYGADPTACPSGRWPWPVIITELGDVEEDDMAWTDPQIAEHLTRMKNINAQTDKLAVMQTHLANLDGRDDQILEALNKILNALTASGGTHTHPPGG